MPSTCHSQLGLVGLNYDVLICNYIQWSQFYVTYSGHNFMLLIVVTILFSKTLWHVLIFHCLTSRFHHVIVDFIMDFLYFSYSLLIVYKKVTSTTN
jgi:hypothetical protein